MIDIMIGLVVKSVAGHDKNEFFVILNCDDEYVFLCDGKKRKLSKPKKKKVKHISVTNTVLSEDQLETNRKIKKALDPFFVQKGGNCCV